MTDHSQEEKELTSQEIDDLKGLVGGVSVKA